MQMLSDRSAGQSTSAAERGDAAAPTVGPRSHMADIIDMGGHGEELDMQVAAATTTFYSSRHGCGKIEFQSIIGM